MNLEFKSVFLICIDYGDDTNYVLAKSFSMRKAEYLVDVAKNYFKNNSIYITIEKLAINSPLKDVQEKDLSERVKNPTNICICGKNPGGCIGSLSCKCNAIANCKRVTDENPLDFENYSYQKKPELESTSVEVVNLKRGIVEVIIPEWDPEEIIGLSPNEIGGDLRKSLSPGLRLIADVNLDASKVSDLILENLRIDTDNQIEKEDSNLEENYDLEDDTGDSEDLDDEEIDEDKDHLG